MVKRHRILKDHAESGAMNALVAVHAAVDDQTFVTKSGDLITVLAVEGVDAECLDAVQTDRIARRFESALRIFDEKFRVYQYLIKRSHAPIPARTYDDPVVHEAISSRVAQLQDRSANLYTLDLYFVVVYEGWTREANVRGRLAGLLEAPLTRLGDSLSSGRRAATLETDLDHAREVLAQAVRSFVVQLPDAVRARVLDKQGAYRFLRRLVNYAPYKAEAVRLKYDAFVDFQACDSQLECHRDHLRLDDFYVQVLTLKELPSRTFAHLLRGLQEIACEAVIVSEWRRETPLKIRKLIDSKRRHFHSARTSMLGQLTAGPQATSKDMLVDDSAVARVSDLGACLEELEIKGRSLGEFSLTIVLFSEDHATVKRAVAECVKVFATHDAQLLEERYNLLNAWLAALPGNSAYNLRRLWLLDTNYADLSFLFGPHPGEPENPQLGAEYLAVFESDHHTPYFFNLHWQDIAHTLVLGATGSGKSFLFNFLLMHLQKYAPLTQVFDLGGSYEHLTRLLQGSYLPIGAETRAITINPFVLPPTLENLQFLLAFLKVLMESGSYRLSAHDERDLYEQIENLYVIEPEQRRLFTLFNMLNRSLRAHLEKWVEGGPFASWFDNAGDSLTFERFQAFDFEGMARIPEVLEPLLFYVLHRASAVVHDEARTATFKVFVIDEAWRFLRHPTIKAYVLEALKTWRKKNAAMILATQSSDDLLRSEMLSVVVESCPTKLFLANPDMDAAAYREVFHLNETEASLISQLIPKQQFLLKRPDRAKVLNLRVGPKDYWLYTSHPQDRERRRQAFERYGFEEGLEQLARGIPTVHRAPMEVSHP